MGEQWGLYFSGNSIESCVSRGGFGRGSMVVCAVMVSIFLSYLYSWCCVEGAEGSPWALSVSTGAKPAPNGDVREGALTWQSEGTVGKAVLCLGNVSVPETADRAGRQAAKLIHRRGTGHTVGSASCQGRHLQDDTWHRHPRAACPRGCGSEVGFSWPGGNASAAACNGTR